MSDELVTVADLVTAVGKIRKGGAWSSAFVEKNIRKANETRSGVQTVIDTLHAALDADVKTPGAIPHHHYLLTAAECGTCTQRDKRTSGNPQAPPIVTCGKCGRQIEETVEHACVPLGTPTKPAWWTDAQVIHDKYAKPVKDARTGGEYALAFELEVQRDTELDALLGGVDMSNQPINHSLKENP